MIRAALAWILLSGTYVLSQTPAPVALEWEASASADVAGYHVYRSDAACGSTAPDFRRITDQPVAATSYADASVAENASYCWRVTAVDDQGAESDPSNEVGRSVGNLPPLPPGSLRLTPEQAAALFQILEEAEWRSDQARERATAARIMLRKALDDGN